MSLSEDMDASSLLTMFYHVQMRQEVEVLEKQQLHQASEMHHWEGRSALPLITPVLI